MFSKSQEVQGIMWTATRMAVVQAVQSGGLKTSMPRISKYSYTIEI